MFRNQLIQTPNESTVKNNALNGKQVMEKDTAELFDDDETESIPEEVLLDERKQMAEKVIKAIDKYSVIIFLLSFLVFVGFYWYRLLEYYAKRYDRAL